METAKGTPSTTSSTHNPRHSPYLSTTCAAPKLANSRRRTRSGFTVQSNASTASPEFLQPSKAYSASKHATTPPTLPAEITRKLQISQPQSKTEFSKASGPRRDNKPKPYVLESPPQAQRLPNNGCSDFYPWKGNHPEDHVTDAQARNGQYDKLFVGKGNNEQASARNTLAPIFKQRTGLTTLSALYLTILEKRQNCSRLSAASTFKPPPRVTLPDPRREAWLRDLATPTVPLRRLSRTIPHGLKGPTLLEQCASKHIPAARAVWFVRCVGANELRGLKRKGVGSFAVGGEAKWIREWTAQVIQFLEKTLSCCGKSDNWYRNTTYVMRLVVHLHAECLLDRNIFIDWLLSFFESSSLDTLPLACSLATAFWDDIIALRKAGRRFSDILIAKLNVLWESELRGVYIPLLRRLAVFNAVMFLNHRRSLIRPHNISIPESSPTFLDCRDRRLKQCLGNVVYRQRLVECSMLASTSSPPTDIRGILEYLDQSKVPFDMSNIYSRLGPLMKDSTVIQVICEWAATPLRAGSYRAFLAIALLRSFFDDGGNIQEPIFAFLESLDRYSTGSRTAVYFLVSELVRVKVFSVSAYMKWLIARGTLSKIASLDDNCPCHVRLLAEIPAHTSSPRVRNLRRILLARCSFDSEQEENLMIETRDFLLSRGILNGENVPGDGLNADELRKLSNLTRAVMSEVSGWLRNGMRDVFYKDQRSGRTMPSDVAADGFNKLGLLQLHLVRQVLEAFDELETLGEVIRVAAQSDNSEILAFVTDTVICNLESFSVLGFLEDLVQSFTDRYKAMQQKHTLDKEYLSTLSDLFRIYPIHPSLRSQVEHDLATYDQQYPRPSIAQSPISESMGDIFDDDSENNEEIERLWNMGAVVDKPTISRLFETTVSNMETGIEDSDSQTHISSAVHGLIKLRHFNEPVFDGLVSGWVTRMQQASHQMSLFRALSKLIAVSCVKIEDIVEAVLEERTRAPEESSFQTESFRFVANCLELIVHDDPFDTAFDAKELRTLKRKRLLFLQTHVSQFLELYRRAIERCVASQDETSNEILLKLVGARNGLGCLRTAAARNLELLRAKIVDPLLENPGASVGWLQLLIDSILDDRDVNDAADSDAHVKVARLLSLANDFSIGLCKMKMQIIFNNEAKHPQLFGTIGTPQSGHSIARSFIKGIASSFHDRRKVCGDLVSVLNKDCANQIRGDIEELFLDSGTFLRSRALLEQLELPAPNDNEAGESLARAFLSITEATAFSVPKPGLSFMSGVFVDRLAKLSLSLSDQENEPKLANSALDLSWKSSDSRAEIKYWFVLFLRLLLLHRGAFVGSKGATADHVRILLGLCNLLQLGLAYSYEAYTEFIHDVASCFGDGLPDEVRPQIRRFLRSKRPVPITSYLLGPADNAEILRVPQKGKSVDFLVKPWERLAEPTPNIGENDTSLSLALFKTRRA